MMSLTYTRDFQINMLINMLGDQKFFEDVAHTMHLQDFDLPACRLIFEVARTYFDKYHKLPTFSVIELEVIKALQGNDAQYETSLQPEEYESLAGVMDMVHRTPASQLAVQYFRDQLRGFLGFVRMAQIHERVQPVEQHIADVVRVNEELNRVNADNTLFINAMDPIKDDVSSTAMRIGTGVASIDRLINHGLLKGQLAMLVACTGVGKTTGMINFAASNALKGYLTLFITLELPGPRITERYQGMMANIDAAYFTKRQDAWEQDVIWRLNFAQDPTFKFKSNVTIADCSLKPHTLVDIERIIIQWKTRMIEKFGFLEDICVLVCVDWIEKVSSQGLHGVTRNTNDATIIKLMLEELGAIARRQNVLIWTATQGTRDAQRREILDIKHTAHSIHAHDPLDLSIGLAPVIPVDPAVDPRYITNDDSLESPPCDRRLNASFMKARYSAITGRYAQFYQGPTLRFWSDKSNSDAAARYAKKCDMEQFYKMLGVQVK